MAQPTTPTKQDDLAPFHTRLYSYQRSKLEFLRKKYGLESDAEVIRKLIDEA